MPKGVHLDKSSLLESAPLRDALIAALENGVPIKTAWVAAGLSQIALYEWLHAAEHGAWRKQPDSPIPADHLAVIRDFVGQVHEARAKLEATLIGRILDAGKMVNDKTGLLDWRPNSWLLEHHPAYKRSYAPEPNKTLAVTLDGRPTRPDLSTLTEGQLIDLAGDEWREILTPREGSKIGEQAPDR